MAARKHTKLAGQSLARSQAMQLLFQAEIRGITVVELLDDVYALAEGPLLPYGEELARGVDANMNKLDSVISALAKNWDLRRVNPVDKNLLRVCLYEMLELDLDHEIAINECVILAKIFSTPSSYRFVNGMLGAVSRILGDDLDIYETAERMLSEKKYEKYLAEKEMQ